MRGAILWGGTGQAKVLNEALGRLKIPVAAIVDNRSIQSPFPDVPMLHGVDALAEWLAGEGGPDQFGAAVAVGGARGRDRLELMAAMQNLGLPLIQVVHTHAFIAHGAHVGEGGQILAHAAVCAGARLGAGVIVNTAASVDHDTVLGDGVHIAPGARLAGEIRVGDCAFIGTGAIVLPGISIGPDAIVGAGAVVIQDVPASTTVVGNPARIHRAKN